MGHDRGDRQIVDQGEGMWPPFSEISELTGRSAQLLPGSVL